jgi:hypothetical protein
MLVKNTTVIYNKVGDGSAGGDLSRDGKGNFPQVFSILMQEIMYGRYIYNVERSNPSTLIIQLLADVTALGKENDTQVNEVG